jgi:hypothetical protein
LRRRKTRTKRAELGAAAAAAALCLTACGGAKRSAPPPPAFSRAVAASLAAQSDAVASALSVGDSCRAATLARRLQQDTIAAINEGRVSGSLQEQLSGAVNSLVARVHCVPPPVVPAPKEKHPDHGKHKEHHGKKHDQKKHKEDEG